MDKKNLMGKNNICILIGLFVIGYLLYNMNNPNNPNKPVLREHYEQPQEEHNAPIDPPTQPLPANPEGENTNYGSVSFEDGLAKENQLFVPNNNYPADCFPRDKLTATDLLPNNNNNTWGNLVPEINNTNFLTAGASYGINTVGSCNRNSNQQLRSEIPNPQVIVSPWMQSTIEPDTSRRLLDIGNGN